MSRRIALPLMLFLLGISFFLISHNQSFKIGPETEPQEFLPSEGKAVTIIPAKQENSYDSIVLRNGEYTVFLYLTRTDQEGEIFYSLILMHHGIDDVISSGYGTDNTIYTLESFENMMEFYGFVLKRETETGNFEEYYGITEEGAFLIAENFGWKDEEIYQVDFDQDGKKEVICNATYLADGVERVYIFRYTEGVIERGYLEYSALIPWDIRVDGVGAIAESYDADRQVICITHSYEKGTEVYEVEDDRYFIWEIYQDFKK